MAALRAVAAAFREAGLATPELDARALLLHATGLTVEALVAAPDAPLPAAAAAALAEAAARRRAGEPVARIVGTREFWGQPFRLGPATLVPRPETETVVEAAMAALGPAVASRQLRLLDLGTGSGAILLALLGEYPLASGLGVDRAEDALRIARDNAARLGLGARAAFFAGDWAAAIDARFDLVVANPPYVETAAIAALAPEVARHDPALALDGGADGLDAYRAIAAAAPALLDPDGALVIELGAGQEAPVAALMAAAGLAAAGPARPDLAGIPRALSLRLRISPWKIDRE
ncbi:MAG TPA: peptide chain release factor N(5)-glutamine methyltransferase [Hyphomicrobiales bacterium]|nr:peptide chain release factor N(5)-glutamine methyltransferase [Hyphomicrobiales bacterium]